MRGSAPPSSNRRRLIAALGASVVAAGLAGCAADDGEGSPADDSVPTEPSGSDSTGGPDGTGSGTTSPTDPEPTSPAAGEGDGATLDLSLRVRGSRSNVDRFETLRTTFESVALQPSGGEAVQLTDSSMDFDLTELEPGEDVSLFEAPVPAGDYDELALVMPIQQATLDDGSEPEFSRTVPATAEFRSPFEVEAGDTIEFSVLVALVRIAGGETWTYTIGYSYASA